MKSFANMLPLLICTAAGLSITACNQKQTTPTDIVNETFSAVTNGNYYNAAQYLYTDTTLALSDADTATFGKIMTETLANRPTFTSFTIDTVAVNDSVGDGFFKVTLTLSDSTTVSETGKLLRSQRGDWRIDVAKVDPFTRNPQPNSVAGPGNAAIPYMRHALAKIQSAKNDPVSQYTMATYAKRGLWEKADKKAYFDLSLKAAEGGVPEAMYAVACCYANGEGTDRDLAKYTEWIIKGKEAGDLKSTDDYLWEMLEGSGKYGIERNAAKAFELAGEQYAKGNPFSGFFLAYCYSNGKGTARDKDKALEMYRQLAEQGETLAMYNLAVNAERRRNFKEAQEWYEKGAELNDLSCLNMAAYRPLRGVDGIPLDKEKARKFFIKMIELGDSSAIWSLENQLNDYTYSKK